VIVLRQVPLPPTPAPPMADPNFIWGRLSETVAMVLVLIGVLVVAVKVLGPLARAWAHKLEGRTGDPQLRADVEQMREQLGEVDSLRVRMGELEERLEFTERLLTQRRDQDLLQRGSQGE
jgi:Tfp pilus assembly protein PilO